MGGSEHGKRYFWCKHEQGIFVRLYAIKKKLNRNVNISRRTIKTINKSHFGALPTLPQSRTVSEANSSERGSSNTSTSTQKNGRHYNLKLNNHTISHRPGSTRASKKSSKLSPWHQSLPRPKSTRASKSNKKNKMTSFLSKSPKKAKTPRSAIKAPSFVLSTKPTKSVLSIKRSLTPNGRNGGAHFKNNSLQIIEVGDESDTDSDSGSDEHNLLTTDRVNKYEDVILPMERASTAGITDKIKKKRDKSKKKKSRKRSKSKKKKKKKKKKKRGGKKKKKKKKK